MFELKVPVVCAIIGEGGSGGAIGLAVGNTVLMQEHAIYSVIPPEGCAAILWRMPERGPEAAEALQLTAQAAIKFQLIDEIVAEPKGGAHRDPIEAASLLKKAIVKNLESLAKLGPDEVKAHRSCKFRGMGLTG
jgi:acetyl-CoA carboxylase carboxyl transferase subunit alpha